MPKAERHAECFQFRKLLRRHETLDRQMLACRLQILADRGNVNTRLVQIAQKRFGFIDGFAESHHKTGLRHRAVHFRARQNFERLPVIRLRPHAPIQARNRLHIVIENFRLRAEHGEQRFFIPFKIRNQNFDGAIRQPLANLANRQRKNL